MKLNTHWFLLSVAAIATGGLGYFSGVQLGPLQSQPSVKPHRHSGETSMPAEDTKKVRLALLPKMSLEQVLAAPEHESLLALLSFLPHATAAEITRLVEATKAAPLAPLDYDRWEMIFERWTVVDAAAAEAFANMETRLLSTFRTAVVQADPSQFQRILASIKEDEGYEAASVVHAHLRNRWNQLCRIGCHRNFVKLEIT